MLKNIFKIKKGTVIVISTMTIIVLIGITTAWLYYGNINKSEDPRVVEAKLKYKRYNTLAEQKKYDEVFNLLDSIYNIYNQYDDYKNSYEIGVILNNKAALYLTIALFETQKTNDSLLSLAKVNIEKSIKIYETWLNEHEKLSEIEIREKLKPIYYKKNNIFDQNKTENYINKRTKEIILAQAETKRRLSVSYTNLGIIQRHENKTEEALKTYKKALDLWKNNLTAENNINIILGKPLRKRTILEKIFPEKK